MASQHTEESMTYEKEKERFIKELQHFHDTRGTPTRRIPKINGHEVDLYLLYSTVTSRGGWVKVNTKNEWDQVLEEFNIPRHCVNSDVAIKQIYLRYLDRYEKMHFHGEVGIDDDEISRHRQWSARALHSIPMTYNHAQHHVNESLREHNGLSIDLYSPSEYDKLGLSLISPLPNEQDFAVNVCTLLSNEGKHCLKLKNHPRLLYYLLAHAVVFQNPSLRVLFHEVYGKYRGHAMSHFWRDVITDEVVLKLADETQFIDWDNSVDYDNGTVTNKTNLTLESEDQEIFCLGRTLGVQDYIGQRVCQIATILRNLTFVADNLPMMGKDLTFLRFIVLCCYTKWDSLHQMGWDMLCNVAPEISDRLPIIESVLQLTRTGLLSEDRADILAALEVLTKLAQNEMNEELLIKHLQKDVYERICSFLTLHDIMLLVCTLECLNAITALGEKACNYVLSVHGVIDILVALVSVEAQSYGPKACIQMRVVETVRDIGAVCPPGQSSSSTATPQQQQHVPQQQQQQQHSQQQQQHSQQQHQQLTQQQQHVQQPQHIQQTPHIQQHTQQTPHSTSASTPVISTSTHQTPTRPQTVVASQPRTVITSSPSPSVAYQAQAAEQIAQENEKFALAWLRCTFEPSNGGKVEQAELYKQYINYCAKIGRRGVIAPLHFPRIVRSVFGGSVGPKVNTAGETAQHIYEGIQLRVKPLTSTTSSVQPPALIQTSPSSILKAQLSAPPKPTPTTPVKVQLVSDGSSPPNATSLMKTLLANKIAEHQLQLQEKERQHQIQQQLLQQQQQQTTEQQQHPTTASDESSSQSSSAQDAVSFKINGIRSLLEILGKDSSSSNQNQSTLFSGQIARFSTPNITEDASNNSVASSSTRPDLSEAGTEENSKSSLDSFLQNALDSSTTKDPIKIDIKSEPDINGSSSSEKVIIKDEPRSPLTHFSQDANVKEEKKESLKRPSEDSDEKAPYKKKHLNGDESEDGTEKLNVSSSAANLYAALAADVLEDEPIEETPVAETTTIPNTQPTQILVTAGGQLAQVVSGHQYVVGGQSSALMQDQTGKQTVLVAQTAQQQGTTAKTIIILQPQGTMTNQTQQVIRLQFPTSPPVLTPTVPQSSVIRAVVPQKHIVSSTNIADTISKVITSAAQISAPSTSVSIGLPSIPAPCATFVSVSSSNPATSGGSSNSKQPTKTSRETKPTVENTRHFLCEWRGCMRNFNSENEVYLHACDAHLPQGSEEIQCLWERCDAMKRKRFSLMTHLYDKHCNPDEMKMVAARRKQLSACGKSDIPAPAIPHPGYAPNAAYHAIKRHALDIVNAKDAHQRLVKPGPVQTPIQTEQASNEGPVTKSIRLTAALILRNLVVYSTNGRRILTRYESFLACIALSNVEASRTLAHVLYDLCQTR